MKQNERWLVYAVTGFLALILVVALVFTPDGNKNPLKSGTGARGLDEIIGNKPVVDPGAGAPLADGKQAAPPQTGVVTEKTPENLTGLPSPKEVASSQPLNATPAAPLVAADLVLQALGTSRIERGVRFVRVLKNDTLEGLVKRWCGARDPFLAEAQSLNEELSLLRLGQEVALPLVADEVLLASIEAAKPKTLMPVANDKADGKASVAGAVDALLAGTAGNPVAANNAAGRGANNQPVVGKPEVAPVAGGPLSNGRSPAAAVAASYTVKDKDSLWGIAAKTYGKKNADRMIPRIKDANPGLGDTLHPGQKLVLPPAE